MTSLNPSVVWLRISSELVDSTENLALSHFLVALSLSLSLVVRLLVELGHDSSRDYPRTLINKV